MVAPIDDLVTALRGTLPGVLDRACLLRAAETGLGIEPNRFDTLVGLGILDAALGAESGGLGLDDRDLVELFAAAGEHQLPASVRDTAAVLMPVLAHGWSRGDQWAGHALGRLRDGSALGGAGGSIGSGTARRVAGRLVVDALPVWLAPGARMAAVVTRELAAAVELGCAGRTVRPVTGIDPGQGLAMLSVDIAADDRCVVVTGAAARTLWRRWQLTQLADLVGCGEAALRRSRDHAVRRKQFGHPIATFQAVAHLLADMYVGVTAARSMLARLAGLLAGSDAGSDAEPVLAAAGCWLPARIRRVCEQAIQVHGGAGFSWELGLHLLYRRALAIEASFGGRFAAAVRAAEVSGVTT